jgi:hypothetical protein
LTNYQDMLNCIHVMGKLDYYALIGLG